MSLQSTDVLRNEYRRKYEETFYLVDSETLQYCTVLFGPN
jgi:hypothetical protein